MNLTTLFSAALAVGLTAPLLTPAHSVAAPLPTTPVPQKVTLVQTKHADVDGDGRRDTVRIYNAGKKGEYVRWKVSVTTAAKKTSSLTFTNQGFGSEDPWYGWAKVDGTRGAELLLDNNTEDFNTLTVLTWQGGKLQLEKAPADPGSSKHQDTWSAPSETPNGFRFFTASGKRYVNVWMSTCQVPAGKVTGTCPIKTLRSVWRNGAWHTVGSVTKTKIPLAEAGARSFLGKLVVHR